MALNVGVGEVHGACRFRALLPAQDEALPGEERLRMGLHAPPLPGVGGGPGKP